MPPPLVCKNCGQPNRRYSTRDNGKGKRYYNLVCSKCKGQERRRQIRLLKTAEERFQDSRRDRLRTKFKLTPQEYDVLLESQGGVCAICKQPNPNETFMPVDHDHVTGKVRGILCPNCNNGLGRFKDDVDRLSNAIDYLKDSKHEL